jgi:hypothetical protein
MPTTAQLEDMAADVAALFVAAEEEPAAGKCFWSVHKRDSTLCLDEDEALQRLLDNIGFYVIEVVFDDDLELKQREGRTVRTHAELQALLRERVTPLSAPMVVPTFVPKASMPAAKKTGSPVHGALLAKSLPTSKKQS